MYCFYCNLCSLVLRFIVLITDLFIYVFIYLCLTEIYEKSDCRQQASYSGEKGWGNVK